MKIAKWSIVFGVFVLCALFFLQYVNWQTGEVYPLFQPTPTSTPTLIDQLGNILWEADESPQDIELHLYGDFLVITANVCDLGYAEHFDLVVGTAQELLVVRPTTTTPRMKIMTKITEKPGSISCIAYLSDMSGLIEEFERVGW